MPKMSVTTSKKIESNKEQSNDIYSIFQNSINKYFSEIKGNTADYLQAVTDLQQEIIESREMNVKNAIKPLCITSETYEKLVQRGYF